MSKRGQSSTDNSAVLECVSSSIYGYCGQGLKAYTWESWRGQIDSKKQHIHNMNWSETMGDIKLPKIGMTSDMVEYVPELMQAHELKKNKEMGRV